MPRQQRQQRSPGRSARLPDGATHPTAIAATLGPHHRNMHQTRQNRTVTVQDNNRLRVVPDPHPLSNVAATNERLTPPESSEDEIRARLMRPIHDRPPSPTGAVYSMSTNNPEINQYLTVRSSSPGSETTAVERVEQIEPVNTQTLREQLNRVCRRPRRERFDPAALAALVSDPEQSDPSSDELSDEEVPATSALQSQAATAAPENSNAWQQNCDLVDWDAEVDAPEPDDIDQTWLNHTPEGNEYRKFLNSPKNIPIPFLKPAFRPKGRWQFTEGQDMKNVRIIKPLGDGTFAKAYIKEGEIYGEKLTFVSKEWDVGANTSGLFAELALYSSPKYLRDLDCVPQLIGLFRKFNKLSVAFTLPHAHSWVEAHPGMSLEIKERIVEVYRKIHARGVLHGDVAYRHILVGDDHKVTIIDFNIARALSGQWNIKLDTCEESEMEREIREVKVKLRMPGAIVHEVGLIDRHKELKALEDAEVAIRVQEAKAARAARRSKKRKAPGDDIAAADPLIDFDDVESLFSEDEGRQEDFVYGVDERLLQEPSDLYNWIVTEEVSRRITVPGGKPDFDSLPLFDPDRKEDEFTTNFLRSVVPNPGQEEDDEEEKEEEEEEVKDDKEQQAAPPQTDQTSIPLMAPTQPTDPSPPVHPHSFWSLPRRAMRKVSSCLTAMLPFTLASPSPPSTSVSSQEPEDDNLQERPRKRARI